eukprot:m.10571 g.10571  ORF g.10571 m.10571 type:complete len:104 (+) comp22422_c0_seq2:1364-1675(+)
MRVVHMAGSRLPAADLVVDMLRRNGLRLGSKAGARSHDRQSRCECVLHCGETNSRTQIALLTGENPVPIKWTGKPESPGINVTVPQRPEQSNYAWVFKMTNVK